MNLNKHTKPLELRYSAADVLLIFALVFSLFSCSGLETSTTGNNSADSSSDYVSEEQAIRYEDWIYRKNIHTAKLHLAGNPLSSPYIELGGGSRVQLTFDDLNGDYKDYYYRIVHCDSYWQPTDMLPSQYIRGFYESPIENYDYSFNTFHNYTHYSVTFPNSNMGVKVSGNYLMVVYENGQSENPILTKRFVVYEQLVTLNARVKEPTVVSQRRFQQEVDLTIFHKNYQITEPYVNLDVNILQNNRWDHAIMGLKPKFVKQMELVYDYNEETTFDGGNEFREFDLKHLKYSTIQVDSIRLRENQYFAYLLPDLVRRWDSYRTVPDINGRFLVKNDEAHNDAVESHYVKVYFTLPYETAVPNASIYIFGALSQYQYLDKFKMHYNYEEKAYKAEVLLKQGYYNYQYLMLDDDKYYGDVRPIEGTHYQTQNEYAIFVYNKENSRDYDRVVGAAFLDAHAN